MAYPLSHLLCQLIGSPHASLLDTITLDDLLRFVQVTRHLKKELSLHVPAGATDPPYRLPVYIHNALMFVLQLSDTHVVYLWEALKHDIWTSEAMTLASLHESDIQRMNEYGKQVERPIESIAYFMFYPPVSSCVACHKPLLYRSLSRYRVTYFSIQHGAQSALMSSLSCPQCAIRHYPNYYVHDKMRHYYSVAVPNVIQIEEHALLSTDLCELFTFCMLFAWVSSQNCGNIYNAALASRSFGSTLEINSVQVFRGFTYNALLRECAERSVPLVLKDAIDNDGRLKEAMEHRNDEYVVNGQPERMHACNICEQPLPLDGISKATDGINLRSFRAVVTDGITLGRPCCKVHNCKEPLVNNHIHFCQTHSKLVSFCAVTDCTEKASQGFQTCSDPTHRKLETSHKERGKSMFQLAARLKRAGHPMAYLSDSMAAGITEAEDQVDDLNMEDPSHKSDLGNVKVKARFGRRRTHNEQLVVGCCGIIVGRATMFGAEAISGVKDALKAIYQSPEDLPDVIFYDNNCNLQAHLHTQKDHYFRHIILPVDVFHFKSKHKITDEFCQKHCNPAQWPELIGDDGKWRFNSSVAEQVNVWMGGYIAMVREMLPHRYEFFLDEMIKRRNELLVDKLHRQGHIPYHIPLYSNDTMNM